MVIYKKQKRYIIKSIFCSMHRTLFNNVTNNYQNDTMIQKLKKILQK